MEELANLFHGFAVVIQPFNLAVMVLGIVLGVLIGVLPGLGGANGIAILLPLTFSMSPTSAIIMLSCIYWGALFGGAITSVLFNIPGEPWSVATTFDGHPMAQQGKAGEALTAAFTSSFVGALVAVMLITFLSPILAEFALAFGPAEFFAVYLLTFCAFIGTSQGNAMKTIASMMLGFALGAALAQMRNQPALRTMRSFHDDPGYIAALAQSVRDYWTAHGRPDMLVMSFHGVPRYTLDRGDPYHCECHKTARLLAEALQLPQEKYLLTFQSRFGRAEWLKPYTAEVLKDLGAKKTGRVDVICPGFVSDCLETLEEIAIAGKGIFLNAEIGRAHV